MKKCVIGMLLLCSCFPESKPASSASEPEKQTAVKQTPKTGKKTTSGDKKFVVHEWGTFTSLQGSDGSTQPGMHYEDEHLPSFVYGRVPPDPSMPAAKQVEETFTEGITQKLETPVIYFYDAPEKVSVNVGFPNGVVSQWYPNAHTFAPTVYSEVFDISEIADGSITWDVSFRNPTETDGIIEVPEDDIWAPSRNVPDADTVVIGDEVERFIFYRGLGRFEMPFRVTSTAGTYTINNESDDEIPAVFILEWDGTTGAVYEVGAVGPRKNIDFSPTPKEHPEAKYIAKAKSIIEIALVSDGLTESEAKAMMDTWERSYLYTPGTRILYVTPKAWTDRILPLNIDPAPDELVRTMVGRVELFSDLEEQKLLQRIEREEMEASNLGRFAEAKLQRLFAMTEPGPLQARILDLIIEVRTTPRP